MTCPSCKGKGGNAMMNVLNSELLIQLSPIRFSYPTEDWKLKFDMYDEYVQDDQGRWFEEQGHTKEFVYLMMKDEI
jgi:multimeric flavodoxin WrbA